VERFLLVCGAGALGCGARYLITLWIGARAFPFATLAVNLIGSFAIALVLELSLRIADFPPNLRLVLATGFLGGLTTYSSFNYESTALLQTGQLLRALLYLGATVIGCFGAGLLGLALARKLAG
jgi:fluoride exporter